MDFQTVYVVSDELAGHRTAAQVVLAGVVVGVVACGVNFLRATPGPARVTAWRDALLPVLVALAVALLGGAVAYHPGWLDPDGAAARYDAGDYQTVVGRVDRVETETVGRTHRFHLHVGGQTLRYDHHRAGNSRWADVRGGTTAESVDRMTALLRDRTVRVRHHDGQVLQLELAARGEPDR